MQDKADGVFGRDSLVGSREVLLICQKNPAAIVIDITVEASLFVSKQTYHYEGEGELQQLSYQLRNDDGQSMAINIQTAPNYGEPDKPKSYTWSELIELLQD